MERDSMAVETVDEAAWSKPTGRRWERAGKVGWEGLSAAEQPMWWRPGRVATTMTRGAKEA